MEEKKSILHELYVFSEWKPEPEYIQKNDNILPENISALWRWLKFFGPKKSLIDSITIHKEQQQKWHIALGDEGKVIAVLADNILEIRTKRSDYAIIAARTTVSRDGYSQWRKIVWSPDCSFLVLAYGNGVISFFDLTASNLFNIAADCSRPGGLECNDNTHAVADIIFMPLRVKDTKWNWEVIVVTFDGRLRGYLLSQTDGYKLHHTFSFPGGVSSVTFSQTHLTLYVAGVPRGACKDPTSPLSSGITAWRILNDDPFYKLSVVSDQLEAQLANERFQLYIPFLKSKNLAFIVCMVISPDESKLVCLHCNGDISVWRLPLLKLLQSWPLALQPGHDVDNPLLNQTTPKKNPIMYHGTDVNWWSNTEIILSRFNGAVTICNIENMVNILGKKPEFFQGTPQVTCAHDGSFMALECESAVLPAKKSRSDDSMEVVKVESEAEDTMLELTKELFKSVLFAITDMETFQPKPKRITVVSRIYRLLGVKSTTPTELFSRKIESGNYSDALTLAEIFNLDSDLVYQQQWRKNAVSTDAIQNYLSKVRKKIWAVHQCVDRLPETLTAAKELLQFGLELTNQEILNEVNNGCESSSTKSLEEIVLEDLNAYTSELLRCRHVMLFYKERLKLYEEILKCEKSSYVKDEYDRLRSHSIVHSAMEIAKEGRINALVCLWPHMRTVQLQLAVLEKLPETVYPCDYQQLLPVTERIQWIENKPIVRVNEYEHEKDWCRKLIFRSIWSSNWSEDSTPESETSEISAENCDLAKWYEKRAKEIEGRSRLVSHALALITLATVGGGVKGLDNVMFHLQTLDTLVYDINLEDVTLKQVEKLSVFDTCTMLMSQSRPATFVSDLKRFVVPFLKRYEKFSKRPDACFIGLTEYLENISVDDLSSILLVLQSPKEFELDVRTHLELAERCILAHTGTDQLDKACDLLNTILKESDGSISPSELVRRVKDIERLVWGSTRVTWRGVPVPPRELREVRADERQVHNLLTRLARTLAIRDEKPSQQDWEKLLKDILELQATIFHCVSKVQCYEIYASSLLTSGDAASIKLAGDVLTCSPDVEPQRSRAPSHVQQSQNHHLVNYTRSVTLILNAAKEYFNSASALNDPALELARCCLMLFKDRHKEIQEELELISALQILSGFDLGILPIQVRLCEDKMSLIEECLKSDPNAFLASQKLLKLADLLRIAGEDRRTREGQVLQLIGEYAMKSGAGGLATAAEVARRLATLRYARAAPLLAHVARDAHAHADRRTRRDFFAAALTYCAPDDIENMLKARLGLELEGLQQMGTALKNHNHLTDRWPSTEEEFSDAITTPVIEKKDLVAPETLDLGKKVPLFNYLLDTFQNKFTFSENKPVTLENVDRSVTCQEFYGSLYPEHRVSEAHYRYDKFSIPDDSAATTDGRTPGAHALLNWFYVENSLEKGNHNLEAEVVQKCAEEIMFKDTPLSVACLLRSSQNVHPMVTHNSHAAVSAALYAAAIKCNAPNLKDNVYLTKPLDLVKTSIMCQNTTDEQMLVIRQCIDKLAGMGEVERLRQYGFSVNGILFNADDDYRREIIYRVARSPNKEHLELACTLAVKYAMDPLEVWLQHAAVNGALARLTPDTLPTHESSAFVRIQEELWPVIQGDDHNALINYFGILKSLDEKAPIAGLTAAEHVKLLKKARAASPDLDYKLLLEQPSVERFSEHMLQIIKPETIGMLAKFLRSLPPAFKVPMSVNAIYTTWLTKYFFSVSSSVANNKKWMQQYRQCASYFNKLSKADLTEFIANTCFSDMAIQRVPPGTRNLMLMQAVDYCQQEQENDFKFTKNEQTWAQIGQELTRWARFLENYHSSTIQSIVENSGVTKDKIWPDIEKSHGETGQVTACVALLVMEAGLRPATLTTLLHCLHVDVTPQIIFEHIVENCVHDKSDIQKLVARVNQYHKEGMKMSDELLDRVVECAAHWGVPPHQQVALAALRQRPRVILDGDADLPGCTLDLLRTEWADSQYAAELTDDTLRTPEGRREAFLKFLELADSWQQKKTLVDVLNCWPLDRDGSSRSLRCDFLHSLLNKTTMQKESLVLVKLLLRQPALDEQEVEWLMKNISGEAVLCSIWIALLNKLERSRDYILELLYKHKEFIIRQEIEDDLIKELLDNGMFLDLVPTPLYSNVVQYVVGEGRQADAEGEETEGNPYTARWAAEQLLRAGHLAEAGHLFLMVDGTPTSLRGFSQTVLYSKNLLKNDN